MQTDLAIIYHSKALDDLHSTSPSSLKVEKYVRTVSHGFIQQLASENKGDSAIAVFDDIHRYLNKHSTLTSSPTSSQISGQIINSTTSTTSSTSTVTLSPTTASATSAIHTTASKIIPNTQINTNAHTQTATSQQTHTSTNIEKIKDSLPMMYTSAIRYTVGSLRSLQQAQRIMDHQSRHGIVPMWSCAR